MEQGAAIREMENDIGKLTAAKRALERMKNLATMLPQQHVNIDPQNYAQVYNDIECCRGDIKSCFFVLDYKIDDAFNGVFSSDGASEIAFGVLRALVAQPADTDVRSLIRGMDVLINSLDETIKKRNDEIKRHKSKTRKFLSSKWLHDIVLLIIGAIITLIVQRFAPQTPILPAPLPDPGGVIASKDIIKSKDTAEGNKPIVADVSEDFFGEGSHSLSSGDTISSQDPIIDLSALPTVETVVEVVADAETDFSGTQGEKGWRYVYVHADAPNKYQDLEYHVHKTESGDVGYWECPGHDSMYHDVEIGFVRENAFHPGLIADVCKIYTVPMDGKAIIDAISNGAKPDMYVDKPRSGRTDGVSVMVFLNDKELRTYDFVSVDNGGQDFIPIVVDDVKKNDEIIFRVNNRHPLKKRENLSESDNDYLRFTPVITITPN